MDKTDHTQFRNRHVLTTTHRYCFYLRCWKWSPGRTCFQV